MDEAEDVLSKLVFIAAIEPGERIDTETFGIQSGLVGRAWRAFFSRGESRQVTYDCIKEILDKAIALTERYAGRRNGEINQKMGGKFIKALTDAIKGIESLKVTYGSDRMHVAKLATMADLLSMRIDELQTAFGAKN